MLCTLLIQVGIINRSGVSKYVDKRILFITAKSFHQNRKETPELTIAIPHFPSRQVCEPSRCLSCFQKRRSFVPEMINAKKTLDFVEFSREHLYPKPTFHTLTSRTKLKEVVWRQVSIDKVGRSTPLTWALVMWR